MRIYTYIEVANATELECHECGAKVATSPESIRLPEGWRRIRAPGNDERPPYARKCWFLCPGHANPDSIRSGA